MAVIKRLSYAITAFFLFSSAAFAAEPASSRDYRAANKFFAAEKYSEALALYKKTLSSPPADLTPGDIHNKIGDTYFRLANYRSALDAYRLAIRDQNPADRAQTQYWIGFCCFLVGRDAEAVDEFLKIPALYPDAGTGCHGILLGRQGQRAFGKRRSRRPSITESRRQRQVHAASSLRRSGCGEGNKHQIASTKFQIKFKHQASILSNGLGIGILSLDII
jgi:tetratricopeptide (TPR) repeat protein